MPDGTKVSPAEASALMTNEGFTYVDVRTEQEFADGHPTGAVNVPVSVEGGSGLVPNGGFVKVMEGAFAKDAPLIVGCKAGGRSARAAGLLAAAGFTRVVDQRAGWDGARGTFGEISEPGWSRTELPTESGATDDRSYSAMQRRSA